MFQFAEQVLSLSSDDRLKFWKRLKEILTADEVRNLQIFVSLYYMYSSDPLKFNRIQDAAEICFKELRG